MQAPATKTDSHPPTLLDLFKTDFPNTLKGSDDGSLDVHWRDGAETKIKRQIYLDFEAYTKFVGFYVFAANPIDLTGQKTAATCMNILEQNLIKQTFDHFSQRTGIVAGLPGQMKSMEDLPFSGRVYIYHDEPLSISQQAEIVRAYSAQKLDVQFLGSEYLIPKLTAWHHEHDKK